MKHLFLIIALTFSFAVFAQPPVDCIPEDYEDIDEDDGVREHDDCALECAKYIYNSGFGSVDTEDLDGYMDAAALVLWWASSTPDYSFMLTPNLTKVFKKEPALMLVYFACMTKAALEEDADEDEVDKVALDLFARYIKNPRNRVEHKGKVKKFLKDYQAGNYSKYIGY